MRQFFQICMLIVILLTPTLRAGAGEIHISAAASLKEVVNALADSYARQHPGVTFLKNYGASGALAKQIASGAPADLFISANPEWMDDLKSRGLVDSATIVDFAYNTLVFSGPAGKAAGLGDLAKLEKIAIGSPKSVPAGSYAMQALTKAGLATALEAKLVMARDVRECLVYAERGEVDGAIVYRTDALLSKAVAILFAVPQELYPRVSYPLALTVSGAQKSEAVAFNNYLRSREGVAILKKYGFLGN